MCTGVVLCGENLHMRYMTKNWWTARSVEGIFFFYAYLDCLGKMVMLYMFGIKIVCGLVGRLLYRIVCGDVSYPKSLLARCVLVNLYFLPTAAVWQLAQRYALRWPIARAKPVRIYANIRVWSRSSLSSLSSCCIEPTYEHAFHSYTRAHSHMACSNVFKHILRIQTTLSYFSFRLCGTIYLLVCVVYGSWGDGWALLWRWSVVVGANLFGLLMLKNERTLAISCCCCCSGCHLSVAEMKMVSLSLCGLWMDLQAYDANRRKLFMFICVHGGAFMRWGVGALFIWTIFVSVEGRRMENALQNPIFGVCTIRIRWTSWPERPNRGNRILCILDYRFGLFVIYIHIVLFWCVVCVVQWLRWFIWKHFMATVYINVLENV